jgi:hypothetical protein
MCIVPQYFEVGEIFRYRQGFVSSPEMSFLVGSKFVCQRVPPSLDSFFINCLQPTDMFAKTSLGSLYSHLDTTARNPVRIIVTAAHQGDKHHAFSVQALLFKFHLVCIK